MRPDEAVEKALSLVQEARGVLAQAEAEEVDQRMRHLLSDAGQVVGEARGNLAMLLVDAKATTP